MCNRPALTNRNAFQEPSAWDDYCRFFWNPAPDYATLQYGSWIVAGGALALAGGLAVAPAAAGVFTSVGAAYTYVCQATYAYATAYAPVALIGAGVATTELGKPTSPAKQTLIEVTSWAGQGLKPDLNAGRWVQIGGPTIWNFIKTGLWGGKFEFGLSRSFPWIFRWTSSNVPFTNYISSFVSTTKLVWPNELGLFFDTIKGLLGQRIIVP